MHGLLIDTRSAACRRAGLKRLVLSPLMALAACGPVRALNVLEPKDPVQIVPGVAYGSEPRQALDVYVPRPRLEGAPIVVFLYGGGWDSGRRQDYRFVGASLASRGYVTVVPDYRLYPQVRWPAFLE